MFKTIFKIIDKLFGVKSPDKYRQFLKERYAKNPELEFYDNY